MIAMLCIVMCLNVAIADSESKKYTDIKSVINVSIHINIEYTSTGAASAIINFVSTTVQEPLFSRREIITNFADVLDHLTSTDNKALSGRRP